MDPETEVTYQLLSDPKTTGVPSFLVNRFARDVPFDTQVGLRKHVRKPVPQTIVDEVNRAMAPFAAAPAAGAHRTAHK